ncbi:response regulator [Phenylobacterium terrae]|uniref:Response regulator n=1 Tax=Phenylobacterium terrae TaxID=2665495 RepID=A0ABW4N6R5_9CAUL
MDDADAPLVLYVEDEPAVLDLGVTALEEGGFRVERAASADDAIRALERHPAFRALVTDIDLPGGADGWDVARRARELLPEAAVIYTSGGSPHDWASKGVPGSIMLVKPFAMAQLVVAVSTAMLRPQSDTPSNS